MHVRNRLTAGQVCQRRLLVPLLGQQMMRERIEYSIVNVSSFVKEEASTFSCNTFNVLFISKLAKQVKGLLGRFTSSIQNSSRLMGFAVLLVCIPVAFLAASTAIECLDVAGNGWIRGTVAAGTDLSSIALVTEGTAFVIR